jgi:hypothetical protein
MKTETKDTAIAVVILIALLLSWMSLYNDAQASENNAVMKYCLQETGYTPDKLETFKFADASRCYHGWKVRDDAEKAAQRQAFLEANPWYKGGNWKWQETAEYRCEKIYSTTMVRNITVCSKPIYIN